ncbi:protein CMSS1 isoform X2 [Austrofundulus limnaeus]|uniref:Protein CMSS1 isoform X2 n=1 Tax=Austrofundulus limnaeus TaxID=52670 RepID=A0A2I4D175_AUSLI|nr:PREDICTED: protein CMSS1 isoform X2 [Austrofundulus limnaeus]
MGDDLGDEWWKHDDGSEGEKKTVQEEHSTGETKRTKPAKRKRVAEKTVKAKKKTDSQQNCIISQQTKDQESEKPKKKRNKKKTITDVLATSAPKPGCPSDLQDLVAQYFSDKRSVIERDELQLQNSCFLSSNDLTHSLSSYLKQVCPKWAKIQKQHTDKSSVVVLIVCSSAVRTIELIKLLTAFKGKAKVVKLFAKHIKIEEQVKLLQKGVTHIGVGTPGRIGALIDREGLTLQALRYVILDWNWRDRKLRRMIDISEVKGDLMKLLDSGILTTCKEDKVKIGLF